MGALVGISMRWCTLGAGDWVFSLGRAARGGVRLAGLVTGLAGDVSAEIGDYERVVRPLLEAHCFDCHGDEDDPKGGMNLERFRTGAEVVAEREAWRGVLEKVESHQMPPPERPGQPTASERTVLSEWIEEVAAAPDPVLGARDPGQPILRRLTRLEYNNAIRDLFGLEMDVFVFPERLPIADKAYYVPALGRLGEVVVVPLREYGLKYPVLVPELGLPGENRAEHGYRNRGEAMNLSPMLLEHYLAAARAIVGSPRLPHVSPTFRTLVTDPARPVVAKAGRVGDAEPPRETLEWPAAREFAPNLNLPFQAKRGDVVTLDYQFRFAMESAVADGTGGVWDAAGRDRVIPAGSPVRVSFGTGGAKALVITARQDLWVCGFSTAGETSGDSLCTNHAEREKVLDLDLSLEGGLPGEGVSELAVCVLSRDRESGEVKVEARFSGGGSSLLGHSLPAGAGRGNTFYAFRAPPSEHIVGLRVDGARFSGNHVLLDDLAFLTDGTRVSAETMLTRDPAVPDMAWKDKRAQARERLSRFLTRAFRRPADAATVERYLGVFDQAAKRGAAFPDAMSAALAAALASPEFLFLAESGIGRGPVQQLDDHSLASRLSFFLWSALPDEELLSAASNGELRTDDGLARQARRLLDDPRSRELGESFAVQWLRLDQLTTAKPDPKLFKAFYSGTQGKVTLHSSMLAEALLLWETVLVENRGVSELINADFTWLNHRLARLYGIPVPAFGARSSDSNVLIDAKINARWARVALTDRRRGGFITMAGPLTVTSLPTRTSPVKRGAWLLETIFNRPPQEPKIAFVLKESASSLPAAGTVRARFENHRSDPSCRSCHIRLDPPGFALERFDAIGAWRERDGKAPVDARSEWGGRAFDGPAEFKALLAAEPEEFTRGFAEHLLSFALGRELKLFDRPAVGEILRAGGGSASGGPKLRDLIVAIVQSYPFRHTTDRNP